MKLKNVKIGDIVEAKQDIYTSLIFSDDIDIKLGTIGRVCNIEGDDYTGKLSVKVAFDEGTWWLDPKNFRKVRPKLSIGDKFVVVSSDTRSVPIGSYHAVNRLDSSKTATLDSMFSMTANKDGTFELKGIDVFLEKAEVELTGSDLTRKLLADGQEGVLCYVDDHSDEEAVKERFTRTAIGFEDGWFKTSGARWRYAVPVSDSDSVVVEQSRWTHRNGNLYTVTAIANNDCSNQEKYPTTVVYKGNNGKVWLRPLSEWHSSMTKVKE